MQCVSTPAPAGTSAAAWCTHPAAALHLSLVDAARPLRRRVGQHLVECPAQVHRGGARGSQRLVRDGDVLPLRSGESQPVRRGDPDRGSPAHGERADRVGHLGGGVAAPLHLAPGQQALVEDDDGVVLEPDDLLGPEGRCLRP